LFLTTMGDRFRELVAEHQHRVYTFATYFLGNPAEAEDVTQEVLLRLWRHLDQVEPSTAGAWLIRVTRNACLDSLRSRKSHGRLFLDGLEGKAEQAMDRGIDPEQALVRRDLQRALLAALDGIGEPQRTIAILREVQDLSYQEIADAMEMPINTVKTYLHRTRRRLRGELAQHLNGVSCHAASA
jgi:RNA polymerase sigma-70 factor, ECF subfamily